MKRKIVPGIMLTLLLIGMLTLAFNIQPVKLELDGEVLFFDDFSDELWTEQHWTVQQGNFEVISGEYFTHNTIGEESITTVDNLILTDFVVEVKVRFSGTFGHLACILFRYTDTEHYYWFHIAAEHDRIAFRMLPTGVLLGGVDYPIDLNVNYTLKVQVIGNTFTGFLNGVEILSVIDGNHTYTSGQVALDARYANVFFDNFAVRFLPTYDVSRDGIVNIQDIVIAALAFGSYPGHPNWNPIVDLNQDGIINIFDLVIIGVNFGKTW